MALSLICALALLVAFAYFSLRWVFTSTHDTREPPLVRPMIPILGHLVGLIRHGTAYYSRIAKKCNLPIFTLEVGSTKTYVVTSASLAAACDRQGKIISFAPCAVKFAQIILQPSESIMHLLAEDLLEEKAPTGLRIENMGAMHQFLMPGRHLDDVSHAVLKQMLASLNSAPANRGDSPVALFQWVRNIISIASTDAFYGLDNNPLRDPDVMDGFWAVDRDFAYLGLTMLPECAVKEASRGRARFFDAFQKYYNTGGYLTACQMIRARYAVNRKFGVPNADIARFDLGVCTALLVNTVPAVFWALLRIYSNQDLLDELRQAITAALFAQEDNTTTKLPSSSFTIRLRLVLKACPLLESLVKEVLRLHSTNSSTRMLLEDVSVTDTQNGDTYLLKKNALLTVPSAMLHNNKAVWGPTAETLDPARFTKNQGRKVPLSANRTFGGGNALCPGRKFASNEIASFLIIVLLRYDIEPIDGEWVMPETKQHISTSILTPVKDVWVKIQERKEARDMDWDFVW